MAQASAEGPRLAAQRRLAAATRPDRPSPPPAQRVKLKPSGESKITEPSKYPDVVPPQLIAYIKQAVPSIDKAKQGKMVGILMGEDHAFATEAELVAYIEERYDKYTGKVVKSEASDKAGAELEKAAAAYIGGKVNRGKGNHDIEWRIMPRDEADALMTEFGYASHSELFDNWDTVLDLAGKGEIKTATTTAIDRIISTPVDVYSSTALALAGGWAKFEKGADPPKLSGEALARATQLKALGAELKYTRLLLIFAADVSEAARKAAQDASGVESVVLPK